MEKLIALWWDSVDKYKMEEIMAGEKEVLMGEDLFSKHQYLFIRDT